MLAMRLLALGTALTLTACGSHANQLIPSASQLGSHLLITRSGANLYVDGKRGNNKHDCKSPQHACKTIAHAIRLSSQGDTIVVAPAIYLENLGIPHSLQITGSGTLTTIIDGQHQASEFLNTHPQSVVTISGLTMRNGGGPGDGGGIYNCFATLTLVDTVISGNSVFKAPGLDGYGGAIYNCPGSTLTIVNSTITKNVAEAGGAICNGGTLTIDNSTFSGNFARKHRGGGIFNYGTLTVNNSTFSGNRVGSGSGGAIHNGELFGIHGRLSLNSSTISRNNAAVAGGLFNLVGATVAIQNSIVANNSDKNCNGKMTSGGYNLSSDDSCDLKSAGDLNGTDPKLGSLHYNGGSTDTMALLPGSPAIDSGNPHGCTNGNGNPLMIDQRGLARPDEEDSRGCDMGAFERQRN
jgi:hypothetical protein